MTEQHPSTESFWDDVRANPERSAETFWDDFYAGFSHGEQGPVNRWLISEVEGLPPGRALDLGSGEGWDAFWLAERGWRVVGGDVSAKAVERAQNHALDRGLADRVTFEQHELGQSFPAGEFDLVSAQFLHSPVAARGERETILARAARAVASGGRLLVVSHHGIPSWVTDVPEGFVLPSPEETLAALGLVDGDWEMVRSEIATVPATAPDGTSGTRDDHVVHARRLDAS